MLARAGLLLLGLLVGTALAELAARVLWKAPWYERLVAEQAANEEYTYNLNDLGLRDGGFVVPKPPGVSRVLILGDSFTFGQGVRNDAAIFPERLERALNASSGPFSLGPVEVLNGGLPGSLTADWLTLWERYGALYEPDLVLIVFFLRDGTLLASVPEFFGRIRDQIALRNQTSLLYRYVFIDRLVRDVLDRDAVAHAYTEGFRRAYFGAPAETAEWQKAQQNLLRIRDGARALSGDVALVIFPVLVELDDGYPFRDICDLLADFARKSGMPVLNLLPAFLGRSAPDLWVSPLDQHPNEKAHALVADALLPFVTGRLQAHAGPSGSGAGGFGGADLR